MSSTESSSGPSPAQIHGLITTHLRQVWSEPSSAKRRPIFPAVYHPDVIVYEPDGRVLKGFDQMDETVEALTGKGGQFEGCQLRARDIKRNGDFVWVSWDLGPPKEEDGEAIEVKATGADGILLDVNDKGEAKIRTLWVIIDGLSDVRP
ncbi:uncharacterized protein AB675_9953 [Cyphellophora attinorum]|uniref:Uncharacterized protein n=1 Tax=Cyphellophora attinorum TaxID=1664694 RepID=A0A0N0NI64_9EURO|nr:uncharacterized protein AB675_9953 [Phialophora attinorum]KPI35368.1 hypothetical protein AB675_9953 [Phialophora attinorum]